MKYAIVIDIGGTNLKYALVNQVGEIITESIIPTIDSNISLTEKLHLITGQLIDYAKERILHIVGIGIGVPSVVDDGKIIYANNLPQLNNSIIDDALSLFKLPIFIDNDANLMGLGEMKYGAAKGFTDVVFLTIGTGIGGALVLKGKIYGGYHNRGTEFGYMIIDYSKDSKGFRTSCSLESLASIQTLINDYKNNLSEHELLKIKENKIDGEYIVNKYLGGQKAAIDAMENHFKYLSIGIANLINIFAPQKVILGGGISESGDFYLDNIRKRVGEIVSKETSFYTKIDLAMLGNKAGFLGAAAVVFDTLNS